MENHLTSLCIAVEKESPGYLGNPKLRSRSIIENKTENPISASVADVDRLMMELYQHAINLCNEFGCPVSSIRARLCSWGIPAAPEVKKGPVATELVFDGKDWSAHRIRVRAHTALDRLGAFVTASASCYLQLDAEPDEILKASRRPGTDIWTVKVASWRMDRGQPILNKFDPHKKTDTNWQLAVYAKIKKATTQKECEDALRIIASRSISRKEENQLYEKIRANPAYKSFNVNFRNRVDELVIQTMAGIIGTATVYDDVISTEF